MWRSFQLPGIAGEAQRLLEIFKESPVAFRLADLVSRRNSLVAGVNELECPGWRKIKGNKAKLLLRIFGQTRRELSSTMHWLQMYNLVAKRVTEQEMLAMPELERFSFEGDALEWGDWFTSGIPSANKVAERLEKDDELLTRLNKKCQPLKPKEDIGYVKLTTLGLKVASLLRENMSPTKD